MYRQIMTCAERDIAVYGTDGAAAMGYLLRIIRYLQALAAVADTDAARAGEAGFFLLSLMALLAVLFCRGDGQVVSGGEPDIVDSIGQRNSYVKTWGCGGFLNETNIYSRGKSLCF